MKRHAFVEDAALVFHLDRQASGDVLHLQVKACEDFFCSNDAVERPNVLIQHIK